MCQIITFPICDLFCIRAYNWQLSFYGYLLASFLMMIWKV